MTAFLNSLHIRDFAIIRQLDIEFTGGFTVLSGETGAGKSILFDALGLTLGDRADSAVVRSGAQRAEVTACFNLAELPAVRDWMSDQDLLDPDEPELLYLRRQVRAAGQSRAFINTSPTNLSLLRELAEQLIGIHGQHAHQALLRPAEQRRLLDSYAGLQPDLDELRQLFTQWQQVRKQRERLAGDDGEMAQRRELLRYQLQELDELEPDNAELAELEADFRRQSEADTLLQSAGHAAQLLYSGDNSLYDQLQTALQELATAGDIDPRFNEARELAEQAQIALKEAGQASESLAADIQPDPEELQRLSHRLDRYQELARKHRVLPEQLAEHWERLRQELQKLDDDLVDEEELQAREAELGEAYARLSSRLSEQRSAAAAQLSRAVTETVQPLGLPHAQCVVRVSHQAEAPATAHGQDQIELCVAMNPDQAPAPLAKVASGGELARTSLAIQVVCLDQSPVPVLLFDEVDVGVGGGVAEVVGRRLKQLAGRYQVFCVTHQPQVAALADCHFGVSKAVADGETQTRIERLHDTARIDELARMLGGVKITEQTRSHAGEMLQLGQQAEVG